MLTKNLKNIAGHLRLLVYRLEYYAEAVFGYFQHLLLGGSPYGRLSRFGATIFHCSSPSRPSRLALFAAYHPEAEIPLSNLRYLQALRLCGFSIFYIHNGRLAPEVVNSLSPYCERVFCRENMGQDFGAWKDGYLHALGHNLLADVEWLLMCNDSNFFLGNAQGNHFVQKFSRALNNGDADLIALNKNYELWQHYQSYFLCFSRSLFSSSSFNRFWKRYCPLSHRYHAINNGEIAMTRSVLSKASAIILYESTELSLSLLASNPDPEEFYSLLPQNAMYLYEKSTDGALLGPARTQQIIALLDCHNPSHAYALMFVRYLSSPFLKKDLVRQGVFSLPQIASLLASIFLNDGDLLWREIMMTYSLGGRHISYIRYPKDAFRKGINPIDGATFGGYGNSLASLGIRKP